MVVLLVLTTALATDGLFWSRLGPASGSGTLSLGVTPSPPRSIPRPTLRLMELPRIWTEWGTRSRLGLLIAMRSTPSPWLERMTFPWPADVATDEMAAGAGDEDAVAAVGKGALAVPLGADEGTLDDRGSCGDAQADARAAIARDQVAVAAGDGADTHVLRVDRMPLPLLPRSSCPVRSVPMKLPRMRLPSEPPESWMPRAKSADRRGP